MNAITMLCWMALKVCVQLNHGLHIRTPVLLVTDGRLWVTKHVSIACIKLYFVDAVDYVFRV